jgi:uncharacterized membrane protein
MNIEQLIETMLQEGLSPSDAVSMLLGEVSESQESESDEGDELFESTEDEIAEMLESGDLVEATVEIDGEEYDCYYSESMGGYFIPVEDDEDEDEQEVDEE